jgi:ABC-type molybdate transport system substrate-binding protein
MKPKVAIIAVFIIAAAVIVLLARGGKKKTETGPSSGGSGSGPAGSAGPGAKPPDRAAVVEITVLYSTEKKEWMEAAALEFGKQQPNLKVTLIGKGSIDAAQAIVDGKEKPTLWSPADSMVLNLAATDYQTKTGGALFAAAGDDAPQPLVLTPLVFAVWQDRAEVLLKASGGAITWKALHKAITSNQGWAAVGGPGKWGFVKLGHTDPTRSNSGLQALYLMSLEFFAKPRLDVEDLLKPEFQEFVKQVEKGVAKFETSTGTFMTDMVRFGPSKYDVAVVYENLAISQLDNAQGRWGNLKVYYPATTLWSDHPMALVQGDWVTPEQKTAARTFVSFLRSRPVQESALRFGFRPADTAVPIKTADQANPFTRLAQYGISVEVPTAAEAPDGALVRNLIMMWSRVVGPR